MENRVSFLINRRNEWMGRAVFILFIFVGLAVVVYLLLSLPALFSGGWAITDFSDPEEDARIISKFSQPVASAFNNAWKAIFLIPIGFVVSAFTFITVWFVYYKRLKKTRFLNAHFVNIVTLLYQEGRQVRRLLRDGKELEPKYTILRNNLANNKYESWKQMQYVRRLALKAPTAEKVKQVFERQFGLTIEDMVALYADKVWDGIPYGGKRWLEVTHRAEELANYLDSGREKEAHNIIKSVLASSFEKGTIASELIELDRPSHG